MKLYRCLYEKEELKLFQNNIICLTTNYNDYSDITLNTHDYGLNEKGFDKKIKRDRIHFFLFKEDAINFMKNYIGHDCLIGEYEIPDYLVIPNLGIGIYTLNQNKSVLEVAIPFAHILREVNYEQYLAYYDTYKYNRFNIKYLNWKINMEKQCNLDRIPSKIVYCDYPVQTLKKEEIETSLYYELFMAEKEYKNIIKLLGVKTTKKENGQLTFEYINDPNLREIRKILLEYNLIEENAKQKRR